MVRVHDGMGDERRDRGSMTVLVMLVCLAVCAAVSAAIVPMLVQVIERQRAQQAADAAALAGVGGGRAASAQLAAANGGVLVRWAQAGYEVTVTVRVGDQQAEARATDAP